ncbi:hypothetical protein SAMN05660405_00483 [Psychrobacter pacificensis]|uniref:Uncharacterized protein n=1 Tax=Psychrobacter pacificensis TaxID=112002 RepID=A0A1G6V8J7_9GAMM|nr:hypothetical protein [Psychrobacter pacificensis]GLR28198.1 hypothetical protein GCM10007915_04360 [Psychrobacter pacificensis]SDD49155.1 hypothetical protein SAMN05660405_00483 [Psychrobacter pacificensis]
MFFAFIIACFIISDDWDEQALLELKEKAEVDVLLGLQTDDHDHESLDIIEAVIKFQLDEVSDVVELLNVNSSSTIIGIDVTDVKRLFKCVNAFKLIQVGEIDDSETNMMMSKTGKPIYQLIEDRNTNGLIVGMVKSQSLSLGDVAYISDAIETLRAFPKLCVTAYNPLTGE